jgi:hypothetical protein
MDVYTLAKSGDSFSTSPKFVNVRWNTAVLYMRVGDGSEEATFEQEGATDRDHLRGKHGRPRGRRFEGVRGQHLLLISSSGEVLASAADPGGLLGFRPKPHTIDSSGQSWTLKVGRTYRKEVATTGELFRGSRLEGSVKPKYVHRRGERKITGPLLSQTIEQSHHGTINGIVNVDANVPVAVAAIMLRVVLTRWLQHPPRIGRWIEGTHQSRIDPTTPPAQQQTTVP